MLRNFLSVFTRILVKHKGFSIVNVLGLTLGFTCFTLITIYLSYENVFARFYTNENRLVGMLSVFSSLVLFIACLGLYGLAAYMTTLRTREFGVRKVMGPTFIRSFCSSSSNR